MIHVFLFDGGWGNLAALFLALHGSIPILAPVGTRSPAVADSELISLRGFHGHPIVLLGLEGLLAMERHWIAKTAIPGNLPRDMTDGRIRTCRQKRSPTG